jgi:hypothetical protein
MWEEFPPISTAEWEATIRADLKDADYAKKLVLQTEEGFAVKPHYRREDLPGTTGQARFRASGSQGVWRIFPRTQFEAIARTGSNVRARSWLVQNTDFLQAITLISTYRRRQEDVQAKKPNDETTGVSCKRSAVLALRRADYQLLRDHVLTGFLRAAKFLTLEHIFLDRDLPYQTQLVPLAAILAELGDKWEEIGTKQNVRQWYWSGVLGELYGGAVESRHARDLPEVLGWIREGAPLPTTVRDSDKVAVDRVGNQEYVVPGDGSEDDRCGGQDAVYDE